jgi:hypothetical protein
LKLKASYSVKIKPWKNQISGIDLEGRI